MKKLLATAAAVLLFSGGVAFAQFGEWDADADGAIAEDEFYEAAGFDEEWSEWDTDADGALSEEEFETGVFGLYDEDDDGVWSEEEYGAFEEDGWF